MISLRKRGSGAWILESSQLEKGDFKTNPEKSRSTTLNSNPFFSNQIQIAILKTSHGNTAMRNLRPATSGGGIPQYSAIVRKDAEFRGTHLSYESNDPPSNSNQPAG
jgi:hypothetical protein